jgi:DNA polymerase-3 subunit delta
MTRFSRIFLGVELGEKQAALDEIEKQLAAAGEKPEKTVYYAGETPVSEMASAIKNGSLFSASRLFIIKNAEAIKKKEDIELLASCVSALPEDTAVVLISEENKIAQGLEKAFPPGAKKIFWELSDRDKNEWVAGFFRRNGFQISAAGVQTVLELVENNTQALERECSRLILFLDKGKETGAGEIEKLLSHTREESAFTLFSRIAAGDFSRSLESMRTLLAAKEAPQTILAGLVWCFRKLRDYLALSEAGVNDDFEYKKIGVSSPQAKRDYSGAGRRYDSEKTDLCLALTAEYDALVRSASSFPETVLMDQYLYKIHCLGAGRAVPGKSPLSPAGGGLW